MVGTGGHGVCVHVVFCCIDMCLYVILAVSIQYSSVSIQYSSVSVLSNTRVRLSFLAKFD